MASLSFLFGKVRFWVLRFARYAVSLLENSDEVAFAQAFQTHSYNACLRIVIDLGIFHSIVTHGKRGVSAEELAEKNGAETALIIRVMRVVTAIGYAREVAHATYAPTPLTVSITKPSIEACFLHSSDHGAVVCSKLSAYLQSVNYQNPTNGRDGPFQYALGTDLPFFDFIHNDPRKLKNFNTFQAGNRSTRKSWLDWFPAQKMILAGFDPLRNSQSTLLVDMGGGTGRDITAFLHRFPTTAGFLVLEDLPRVIEPLSHLEPGVTAVSQDLFTPQKTIGARFYYTHFFLHDFSDDQCRTILRHTAAAMTPGHSRLLLNEMILPDTGCPAFYAAADITMMCVLGAMERSESQWRELLSSAGLRLVKFWYSKDRKDREGIIEAVVET